MPDPTHLATEDDYADLAQRLRAGGAAIRPRGDAVHVLDHAVRRHQRRRTTITALAAAASVAVVGTVAAVALTRGGTGGPDPAGSPDSSATDKIPVGNFRPAALFESIIGGRSRGVAINFHATRGEKMHSYFEWSPDETGEATPYLAGVSLEHFRRSDVAARDCGTLAQAATCEVRDDGTLLATYDVPLGEAFADPIKEAARLTGAAQIGGDAADARVLGVTLFAARGLAVTAYVCGCTADGNALLGDGPPLTTEQLTTIVTDPAWLERN